MPHDFLEDEEELLAELRKQPKPPVEENGPVRLQSALANILRRLVKQRGGDHA